MSTHVIPRTQWRAFLSRFADSHRGRLCSVSISSRSDDKNAHLLRLLLAGIEPAYEDEDTMDLVLADWDGDGMRCSIGGPVRVIHGESPETASETLQIESAHTRAVMKFEAAA